MGPEGSLGYCGNEHLWCLECFQVQFSDIGCMADKMSSETTRATKYSFVPTQKAYFYV